MKKIRVIVAGAGRRSRWGLRAMKEMDDFELVALVESSRPRLERIAREQELGELPLYTDIAECLAKVECDAVVVLTADGAHAEVVVPALGAGKHVFVEKPLEITSEKLEAIISADKAAGEKTFVGFNLRYAPVYVKIRQLIEDGAIGRVLTVQADEYYNGGRTYFRRWNRLRKFGGGLWITKASHDFDLLYWMAGAKPVTVYATAFLDYYKPRSDTDALYCADCPLKDECPDEFARYAKIKPEEAEKLIADSLKETGTRPDLCLFNSDKDTFDHGITTVTFDNNVLATYTCNVVSGIGMRRMRVNGTEGTIDGILGTDSVTLHHRDPYSEETVLVEKGKGGHGGADSLILDNFAKFVRGEPCRRISPEEAAVAVKMGLAATRSGDEKKAMTMDG